MPLLLYEAKNGK